MASIGNEKNGHRRILFYAPDGSRKTIRLGKCSLKDAREIKGRVENLLSWRIQGKQPDSDTAVWLTDVIDASLRTKLERVGLIDPAEPTENRPAITLDAFLTDFLERNGPSNKPATRVIWKQVMKMLREDMPKGIMLQDITAGHAKLFHEKLKARGLASATVHKRIGFARQFFQDAVDWERIDRNPFARVKTQTSSTKSNVDVPRETIERVLRHCDTAWATIVALSRYGGLRCPSEVLSIRWDDIDWANNRMSVPEPKVEHHEGRGVRSVPLFPELRTILDAAYAVAPDGAEYVVDKPAYRAAAMQETGWGNSNLRTQFLKVLRRAGVLPWTRLFHSMRASRQTELERQFPRHVVCAWMGNSESVAQKHYLLVSEADYAAAVLPWAEAEALEAARNPARSDPKAARNPAPQTLATSTQGNEETPESTRKNSVFPMLSGVFKAEGTGLEPAAPCGVPQFQ